jgi:hypothetical protein
MQVLVSLAGRSSFKVVPARKRRVMFPFLVEMSLLALAMAATQ